MQYRSDKKSWNDLSIMGFGCMRFPRNLAQQIDINKTEQLIVRAIEGGINYFDTAYAYGGSEVVLGQILAKNKLREKILLATKLPHTKCKTTNDFESFLQVQLERLKTDYIDYYLIHNIGDTNTWLKLCELGIKEWITANKVSCRIRNIGFSFHGIQDEFLQLLEVYDWDFCQIQYNYINTNYQAGLAGLQKAAAQNLPIIIMEPLLGGKLATGLPRKAVQLFNKANSSLTPAAWGLRWLWNQPEVTVVISGMNTMKQLEDNLETANHAVPHMLTPAENETYDSVINIIEATYKVPCTGCNYCLPCPHKVNIPGCFAGYNVSFTTGMISGLQQYVTSTGLLNEETSTAAGKCIACGTCEKKCPQHIPIPKMLKKVKKRMEPFWLKTGLNIYFKLMG